MTALTGTVELTRFILRRDRIRILVWIVAIVALAALTATGIKGLFPTQAALDQTAAATQHNAAAIAFNGPAQGLNTVGGQVAFQFGGGGMVMVALMSLFMVGRLTRGEEEAGVVAVDFLADQAGGAPREDELPGPRAEVAESFSSFFSRITPGESIGTRNSVKPS